VAEVEEAPFGTQPAAEPEEQEVAVPAEPIPQAQPEQSTPVAAAGEEVVGPMSLEQAVTAVQE
jgi:hypothetical protein